MQIRMYIHIHTHLHVQRHDLGLEALAVLRRAVRLLPLARALRLAVGLALGGLLVGADGRCVGCWG